MACLASRRTPPDVQGEAAWLRERTLCQDRQIIEGDRPGIGPHHALPRLGHRSVWVTVDAGREWRRRPNLKFTWLA